MNFSEYQKKSRTTALYPRRHKIVYPTLGLNGEAGEVAEKVKKIIRDRNGRFSIASKAGLKLELGDVLWYLSQLASDLGLKLEDVAAANLQKLFSRKRRGKIGGSGDDR